MHTSFQLSSRLFSSSQREALNKLLSTASVLGARALETPDVSVCGHLGVKCSCSSLACVLWEGMTRAELFGLGVESPLNVLPAACLGCGWKSTKRWWEQSSCILFL